MLALLVAKLGPAIAGAVLSWVGAMITSYLKSQSDQALGATVEASKVNVQALQTQVAIAQAQADAPHTLDETIAALQQGKF